MNEVRVQANDLTFHTLQAGRQDGPLVLLLHGFPEDSLSWRHQIPALPEWLIRRRPVNFAEQVFRGTAAVKDAFTDDDVRRSGELLAQPGAAKAAVDYYRAAFRKGPGSLKARLKFWDTPISAPTMLIWGMQDTALGPELIDPHIEAVAGPFEIVRVPESGHWVQHEAAGVVNEALLRHLAPLL